MSYGSSDVKHSSKRSGAFMLLIMAVAWQMAQLQSDIDAAYRDCFEAASRDLPEELLPSADLQTISEASFGHIGRTNPQVHTSWLAAVALFSCEYEIVETITALSMGAGISASHFLCLWPQEVSRLDAGRFCKAMRCPLAMLMPQLLFWDTYHGTECVLEVYQAMSALLAAKQRGDPGGWRAFQEHVAALKNQRTRARREAEDLETSLFAAQTALRLQSESALGEIAGAWHMRLLSYLSGLWRNDSQSAHPSGGSAVQKSCAGHSDALVLLAITLAIDGAR